jgi:hypothetical protein
VNGFDYPATTATAEAHTARKAPVASVHDRVDATEMAFGPVARSGT